MTGEKLREMMTIALHKDTSTCSSLMTQTQKDANTNVGTENKMFSLKIFINVPISVSCNHYYHNFLELYYREQRKRCRDVLKIHMKMQCIRQKHSLYNSNEFESQYLV